LNPSHFEQYRKAYYAFFAYVTTATAALASLSFLSGPISHDLAVASAIAGALIVPGFTALSPKNADKPGTAPVPEPLPIGAPTPVVSRPTAPTRAENLAQEVRQFLADAEIIRAAITGPVATASYGPSPTDPTTVIGGVVAPPP
jgi:hypothetical protein